MPYTIWQFPSFRKKIFSLYKKLNVSEVVLQTSYLASFPLHFARHHNNCVLNVWQFLPFHFARHCNNCVLNVWQFPGKSLFTGQDFNHARECTSTLQQSNVHPTMAPAFTRHNIGCFNLTQLSCKSVPEGCVIFILTLISVNVILRSLNF